MTAAEARVQLGSAANTALCSWSVRFHPAVTLAESASGTCGAEARSALERRRAALEPSGPRAPELLHWAAGCRTSG